VSTCSLAMLICLPSFTTPATAQRVRMHRLEDELGLSAYHRSLAPPTSARSASVEKKKTPTPQRSVGALIFGSIVDDGTSTHSTQLYFDATRKTALLCSRAASAPSAFLSMIGLCALGRCVCLGAVVQPTGQPIDQPSPPCPVTGRCTQRRLWRGLRVKWTGLPWVAQRETP
jgi:hypothetical protein